jgi:hypothetical protein
MKYLALLILGITLICQNGKSQNYTDSKYGKNLNEFGQKAINLTDSTILLFGSGQESSFVLYKIKTTGDTLFTKYIDLPYSSSGIDILKCSNGDFILIGNNGGLIKINDSGDIVWSVRNDTITQSAGVLINDTCFAIAGQRLLFSHIEEVPDLGPDSVFYNDIYICLYNQSGKLVKDLTYSFVDDDSERSNDIILNSSGDLVILGNSFFNGMPNEFLLSTDLALTVKLDTIFEYPGIYIANQIIENTNHTYITCGIKYTNSKNDLDILVQEINPGGKIEWEKTFDLNGLEYGNSVIESDGYYYLTGQASNKRNATEQFSESLLLKMNSAGDTLFSQIYQLPEWQTSVDLHEINDTTLLLFGSTNYNTSGGSDFHVIVCSKINGFTNLQFTGIKAMESKSDIMVYPNPAKDNLKITGRGIESIRIIDINGKIVRDLLFENENQEISIADLNPGLYSICFKTKSGMINRKILKQ